MASTYTERKVALDEIAQRSESNRKRASQAEALIAAAAADLAAMPAAYAAVAGDIDTDATASPGDAALQAQKGEKDKLAADFVALRAVVDAMKAALDAL